MLNKTNVVETNDSTKNFTQKMFTDEHTIEQFKRKSIRFIEYHSMQMYKETLNVESNLKTNAPNIRNAPITIQNYINEILQESKQIEQILKNMPNMTNALEKNKSFKEITLEQTKQIDEMLNKTNALKSNKSTEKFTRKILLKELTKKFTFFISSIEDHSIQMYKKTIKILQNTKKITPNITNALKTIQNYINRIFEQTGRIEQILKNMLYLSRENHIFPNQTNNKPN